MKRETKQNTNLVTLGDPKSEPKHDTPKKGNIVLIGMPGAGKSTLGIVLAKMLTYDFCDTDLLIQRRCNDALQHIIDTQGAQSFIDVENETLQELAVSNTLIATGGSAVYSHEGMLHLAKIATIVYLHISYEEMLARIDNLHERGVVFRTDTKKDLRELYQERKHLYERYADVTVDVDSLTISDAANKVIAALADNT
ncbi:MAG: shikimate kinase [Eggerthellaceae bacterium]|jgi:shikimate kinase|nr:shikimate kinase [Eggerthellaceae bacterium]MDR2721353.1 shikimate kinase [Coriobacteriaceae bacterium]